MLSNFSQKEIILGTRGSPLALAQAQSVVDLLKKSGARVAIRPIITKGDTLTTPLTREGGKGLYVKAIEEELLKGTIDIAVHSVKDIPADIPSELTIAAIPEREDPRDAFLSDGAKSFQELPRNAKVGTSSPRRRAELLHLRPDLTIVPMRGNVETRIQKLHDGQVDALLLAVAGLKRLHLEHVITEIIDVDLMIPAVGQGALALEIHKKNQELILWVREIVHHNPSGDAIMAERAFLTAIGGDCFTPLAAHATIQKSEILLNGFYADSEGRKSVTGAIRGPISDATGLGTRLAKQLMAQLR